ncbi:hypothetical protein A8C32_08085 [Flavivirga aquatica]|uniref:Uncharacterized protein n=1 Tax=Flavivirga aquatica TaxID=1849968 RepID=A0A1E5SJ32_9FLAO|nr:hypothetical protein [Flavivirga aquatica]OEJ99124.1 hypothetical protein A8C32_08085 [Flavivirga aquatica]
MSTKTENATAVQNPTTEIKVSAIVGNQLQVQYTGLPGNRPNTYGNYLVVWRNQNSIPYNDPNPDGYVEITGDSSQGSQVFEEVKIQVGVTYVVGYAVGPKLSSGQDWGNVCTTCFIDTSQQSSYIEPEITDLVASTDSVTMNYKLPNGASPQENGAWVGIWQTGNASYDTPPIAVNSINNPSSIGGAAINGVTILIGQIYTVALFTSGWKAGPGGTNVQTAMACTATITT